uniref:Uncharacterized protein n=1 Tax=Oryza brachyantha TaxID=4533 RepID=J3NAL0_ORYBR
MHLFSTFANTDTMVTKNKHIMGRRGYNKKTILYLDGDGTFLGLKDIQRKRYKINTIYKFGSNHY